MEDECAFPESPAAQALRFADDLRRIRREAKESRKELADANEQLHWYAGDLRKTVTSLKRANRELEDAYYDTIRRLVIAAEYKDRETGNHITRISRYSAMLARNIGMPDTEIHALRYASPMHDIGKIGIADRILLKPGRLTDAEYELMKCHTLIGARILANSHAKVLQIAHDVALCHHERWDGTGYPHGIAGTAIPVHARIVALVDAFDALTSKRPYKEPFPIDKSCEILRQGRGLHFDPELADRFLECIAEIQAIRDETRSNPLTIDIIRAAMPDGDDAQEYAPGEKD